MTFRFKADNARNVKRNLIFLWEPTVKKLPLLYYQRYEAQTRMFSMNSPLNKIIIFLYLYIFIDKNYNLSTNTKK